MSQENVEFVRTYFEVWEAAALTRWPSSGIRKSTWRSAEGAIDDVGVIRGVEAMRAYARDWLDNFDDVHFDSRR